MSDIRGIYKHFKGGEYEVFGTCFCEKTNQTFVLYKPLYNETGFWLRPYSMFFSEVIVDNNSKERFSFVKKTNPIIDKQTFQSLDSETQELIEVTQPKSGNFFINIKKTSSFLINVEN